MWSRTVKLLYGVALGLCLPLHVNAQTPADLLSPPKEQLKKQLLKAHQQRKSCKSDVPLMAKLQLAQPAQRGKVVQLVFSVLPLADLTNSEIAWDLDPGIVWLKGSQRLLNQRLSANVLKQYGLAVRFPRPGLYSVSASLVERGSGYQMGRRFTLYFTVTDKGIAVSVMKPYKADPNPQAQPVPPGVKISPPDPMAQFLPGIVPGVEPPPADDPPVGIHTQGTARVVGSFFYMHHDGTLHGAWNSSVQVWDHDTWSGDDLLSEPLIQSDGTFDSGDFNNGDDGDPFDGSQQDVYIRFVSENSRVHVKDNGGNLITIGGPNLGNNISDGTHNIGSWFFDGDGPGTYPDDSWESGFEICETTSLEWLHYNGLGYDVSSVDARWQPGSTDGTYYNGSGIHLLDGDQFDRSVVLHEYGHHVMQVAKGGQPPGAGGDHSWFGCGNGGLAWSEGWATYSGQTTLNDIIYRDTPGVSDSANLSINLETTTGNCPDSSSGTNTEGSVISCLWDMYDNLGGDPHTHDYLSLGAGPIWDTFRFGGTFNNVRDYLYAFMARYGYNGYVRWWASDHNITLTSGAPDNLYVRWDYAGAQFGTPEQPFRTVQAAINAAVTQTRTNVYIWAGTYNEHIFINKPILFYIWGGTGGIHFGP